MFVLKYLRGIRVQLINKMSGKFLLLKRDIMKYSDVVEQSRDLGVISLSLMEVKLRKECEGKYF